MPPERTVWSHRSPLEPDGDEPPAPLPVVPPPAQLFAPLRNPPPVGTDALRSWAAEWRALSSVHAG
jgi:hypothetical protein